VGNVNTMKQAILMSARGWGLATIVGVAPAGAEISARPFLFVTGRRLAGTAFGGVKSRSELPEYIKMCYDSLDDFITGQRPLRETNDGFHDMHAGVGIRTVINMWE
jgi:S-(hydroxymethyl)glutathione dehydrogenase/alcohol dehydrogenase